MTVIHPVNHQTVATEGMVKHGIYTIIIVYILYPRRRDIRILPYNINAHTFQQCHLAVQCRTDNVIGLFPQVIRIVGAYGEVVPVHAADEERRSVNGQLPPLRGVGDLHLSLS